MILQKKYFIKQRRYVYYEYYKNKNKSTLNSVLFQKLTWFGHIYHKIWSVFSLGKCKHKRKKRKSSLEARKMKIEG